MRLVIVNGLVWPVACALGLAGCAVSTSTQSPSMPQPPSLPQPPGSSSPTSSPSTSGGSPSTSQAFQPVEWRQRVAVPAAAEEWRQQWLEPVERQPPSTGSPSGSESGGGSTGERRQCGPAVVRRAAICAGLEVRFRPQWILVAGAGRPVRRAVPGRAQARNRGQRAPEAARQPARLAPAGSAGTTVQRDPGRRRRCGRDPGRPRICWRGQARLAAARQAWRQSGRPGRGSGHDGGSPRTDRSALRRDFRGVRRAHAQGAGNGIAGARIARDLVRCGRRRRIG